MANPLAIIDEVGKVKTHSYDLLAALYSLLEVQTATHFQDQSVPRVFLDLTNVRFMLTANDDSAIPAPLCSRVRTFHIARPDSASMKRIAQILRISSAALPGHTFLPKSRVRSCIDRPSSFDVFDSQCGAALAVRFSNARCIRLRSHQTLTEVPKTWHELVDVSLHC